MPESLASGNSVTLTLDLLDTITVSNADVYHPNGKTSVTTSTTFGPYAGGGVVRIISTGACQYTLINSLYGNAPVPMAFDATTNTITDTSAQQAVALAATKRLNMRLGTIVAAATASAAAGGWYTTGSTLTLVPNAYDGKAATRFDISGAGDQYFSIYRKLDVQTNGCYGKIEIPIFIPSGFGTNWAVDVFASSDAPNADPPTAIATNYTKWSFPNSLSKAGNWQLLSIDPAAASASGTLPNQVTTTVGGTGCGTAWTHIRIYVYMPSASTDRYVMVGDVRVGGYSRPMIMLSFDGAGQNPDHVTLTEPLLRKYGLRAVFACQGQAIAANYKTLQRLKAAGHQIANEGLNHTNYGSSPATLLADYDAAKATLAQYDLGDSSFFAAPQLSVNQSDRPALLARGVKIIRCGNRDLIPVSSGPEPLYVGARGIDQLTSAQMIQFLDEAELHGESMMLLGHGPTTSASPTSLQHNTTELAAFFAELATRIGQGRMTNGTPSEFVAAYNARAIYTGLPLA